MPKSTKFSDGRGKTELEESKEVIAGRVVREGVTEPANMAESYLERPSNYKFNPVEVNEEDIKEVVKEAESITAEAARLEAEQESNNEGIVDNRELVADTAESRDSKKVAKDETDAETATDIARRVATAAEESEQKARYERWTGIDPDSGTFFPGDAETAKDMKDYLEHDYKESEKNPLDELSEKIHGGKTEGEAEEVAELIHEHHPEAEIPGLPKREEGEADTETGEDDSSETAESDTETGEPKPEESTEESDETEEATIELDDGNGSGEENNEDELDPKDAFKDAGIVNVESITSGQIEDVSERVLSLELERKKGESRARTFIRRVIKGGILRGFYKQRIANQYRIALEVGGPKALQELLIATMGNSSPEGSRSAAEAELDAIIQRVITPAGDLLLEEAGEKQIDIADDPEVVATFRSNLNDLVIKYSQGQLDEQGFDEEVNQLIYQTSGINPELAGSKIHFAHNLLEIAQTARGYIESGRSLEWVRQGLEAIHVRGAVAHESVNTQFRKSAWDKLCDATIESRFSGTAVGSTLLFAAAVGACVTKRAAYAGLSAALRYSVGGIVAAAAVAGVNESYIFRHEAAHSRRLHAIGEDIDTDANPRATEMQRLNHETIDAGMAIIDIRSSLTEDGKLVETLTGQDIADLRAKVSSVRSAIDVGIRDKIDLIRYDGVGTVAQQQFALLESLSLAEKALAEKIAAGGTMEIMSVNGTMVEREVGEALNLIDSQTRESFEQAVLINEQEVSKVYRNMMLKRVATAALVGGVAGAMIGAVTQELIAIAHPNITGVFGHQSVGKSNTLLTTLIQGKHNAGNVVVGENLHPYGEHTHLLTNPQNHNIRIRVPEGLRGQWLDGRHINIIDQKGHIIEHLRLNRAGELTHASQVALERHGIGISEHAHLVKSGPIKISGSEFYGMHRGELVTSNNHLMMNNTPRVPDLNELRMQAGGLHGGWFDKHGNVVIRAEGLDPHGSFQGPESVNPVAALHRGALKVFMSINPKHWNENFVFTLRQHGGHVEVVIPKGHPATSLFTDRTSDNYYGFIGRYLGTAIDRGTNPRGVHDFAVINSIKGEAGPMIGRKIARVVTTALDFPPQELTKYVDGGTIPVIGPPLYPRRGIGAPLREKVPPAPTPPYYGGGYSNPERIRQWRSEFSPRLAENPDSELDPTVEIPWYREHLISERGQDYVEEIDQTISSESNLSELREDTKALVTIPVAAATEAENIFKTLAGYAHQSAESLSRTTVMLYVNWVDDAKENPEKAASIEKTLAEIERAKKEFPQLNIAVVKHEFKRSEVGETPLIGLIAPRMMDVALLTINKAVGDSKSNGDVLIIRNDADAKGISYEYLDTMLAVAAEDKITDAFLGGLRWDTEKYKDYPGFGMVVQVMQGMQILARRHKDVRLPTSGANTAVRAAIMAAVGGLGVLDDTGAGSDDLQIRDKIYAAREGGTKQVVSNYGGSSANYDHIEEKTTAKRQPVRLITKATIDTDASRLLRGYLSGTGVHTAWQNFGQGGYEERPELEEYEDATKEIDTTPEDPSANIDIIARRVEKSISQLFNAWYMADPSTNTPHYARQRSVLAMMWGIKDRFGRNMYSLSWKDGKAVLSFTAVGLEQLRKSLSGSGNVGRSYYDRVRRALYGSGSRGRLFDTQKV